MLCFFLVLVGLVTFIVLLMKLPNPWEPNPWKEERRKDIKKDKDE